MHRQQRKRDGKDPPGGSWVGEERAGRMWRRRGESRRNGGGSCRPYESIDGVGGLVRRRTSRPPARGPRMTMVLHH